MSINRATWRSQSRSSRAQMSRLFSITLRASGIADSKSDALPASQSRWERRTPCAMREQRLK